MWMRCASGSLPTLGHAAALRSSERTAAIRSTAGALAVRLRALDKALDFAATEGFFWINA